MHLLRTSLSPAQRQQLADVGATVLEIGYSAGGEPLHAYTIGNGCLPRLSVVAGAHPDEPIGPLAALGLAERRRSSDILQQFRLCVVPLLDVDGCIAQRAWLAQERDSVDPLSYLQHRLRRLPGEDREFAWPGAPWGGTVLPECAAADEFLNSEGPALAHLSLHGMAVAEGAWFLLDCLAMRDSLLWRDLRSLAGRHGFALHESRRYGDKGFRRCGYGFCTTPSGPAMRSWALREQAALKDGFGYGSMDAARARAARHAAPAPLCAVSEFPLLAVDRPGDGRWRDALQQILLCDHPQEALHKLQQDYGLRSVAYSAQRDAMLDMVEAVAAAALRYHGFLKSAH